VNRTQGDQVPGGPATTIRPSGCADLAALGAFFAGLSLHTRVKRFFAPVSPGPAMLRRLGGTAGQADVLVAVRGGVIIGHAMAVDQAMDQAMDRAVDQAMDRASPEAGLITDIGVVVADAWQGRGVGAALMRALLGRAQARGVTGVSMDVLPSNRAVLAMITSHWAAARTGRSADSVTVSIQLLPQPHERQLAPAAAGHRAA
jgi:GNAT superfamily N-acetyltransferase